MNVIKLYYPGGKRSCPTKENEVMLRMYIMQNGFNLADETIEAAIYDGCAMRTFMYLDFTKQEALDVIALL